MGQAQAGRNTLQRPSHPRKSPHSVPEGTTKSFRISYQQWQCTIPVSDDTLTCGWLLSEVIRRWKVPGNLVALRTRANIEILDYWLTRMERTLQPLADMEELEPVFSRKLHADDVPDVMCKEHFEPIKLIGKGGFSRVVEVRKKDTGMLYAIKIMSKSFLAKEEKVQQILTERKVMIESQHPFVVKLHWAFQSRAELYLVMDFCPGGELFFHLHNLGRLTEAQAQFYFAEILLALEYLHQHDIVYRDLKPENVLLDLDGHVRLTDFGLSKENLGPRGISYSFCGSPEYMSPEMLREEGHGRAVDYYSLGAMLYEMLTGLPPFYDKNREKMYRAIQNEPLKLPNYVSKAGRSLLSGLLEKDPHQRLGAQGGFEEIKQHPWLVKVDWGRYLKKKKSPPFIPNLRLSNFDPEYTSERVEFTGPSTATPLRGSDPFAGFEYSKDSESVVDSGGVIRFATGHSKSVSDISNVSTSDTKSQGVASRNISQLQAMTVIVEEEEPNSSPKDIDLSLSRVRIPDSTIHNAGIFSDSEARPRRRPKPELPIDPIPKDAKPARFEGPGPQRRKPVVKARASQEIHLRGPEPRMEQLAPLSSTMSYQDSDERVANYWGDSSDEESIVRQIPDFHPDRNPSVAKH